MIFSWPALPNSSVPVSFSFKIPDGVKLRMRIPGQSARITPQPLRRGETIGVIAPGSSISLDLLESGCATLNKLGYQTFFFDSILEHDLYFAGNHQRRAWELEQMFLRREICGIVCARGGYGCNYLLPHINLETVRAHPKVFMGYSDVTTLLTYICDHADLVTYHGPMVTKDFAEQSGTDADPFSPLGSSSNDARIHCPGLPQQPRPGQAKGVLYGGCLSLLAASLGTPYEIKTENAVLFMEDIAAKPFQIDRMLMQLKYANKFENLRGIIFGEMVDCRQPGGQDYTLSEIIQKVLAEVNVPIAFGLPSGHVSRQPNLTLPIGASVSLEVADNSFTLSLAPGGRR